MVISSSICLGKVGALITTSVAGLACLARLFFGAGAVGSVGMAAGTDIGSSTTVSLHSRVLPGCPVCPPEALLLLGRKLLGRFLRLFPGGGL